MEAITRILILMFSIVLHEIAHGWTALRLGDPTAKDRGRLTLNPISHVDPIGTILVPLMSHFLGGFLFGWAKPVPVDPRYFKNPAKGMAIVGIAGPITNIILALIAAILFRVVFLFDLDASPFLVHALVYAVAINIVLATFNMVPIPPLDGSRVIIPFIPREAARVYYQLEPYGFYILVALLYLGLFRRVITPIYQYVAGMLLGF